MSYDFDEGVIGWNDVLDDDGGDNNFFLLPAGEYVFQVEGLKQTQFAGGKSIPACPQAELTLRVYTGDGRSQTVKENIYMHNVVRWKLTAFFRSIGQKKRGETVNMDWSRVKGSWGIAMFEPDEYIGTNGKSYQKNRLTRFEDHDAAKIQAVQQLLQPAGQHVRSGTADYLRSAANQNYQAMNPDFQTANQNYQQQGMGWARNQGGGDDLPF